MAPLNNRQEISEVYVEDFQTTDAEFCKPSDVDLSNDEVQQFFLKAKTVSYQEIHDHYYVAPCFIEGVLNQQGRVCQWAIQASAIGRITCNGNTVYYACDHCDELFH